MVLTKLFQKIKDYGKLVMFSHTIFSFSFALLSMLLAAEGLPKLSTLLWILVCFLSARTGANAINRVIDAEIDSRNPRTANRQIPKGELNKKEVLLFASFCFLIMMIGRLAIEFSMFFAVSGRFIFNDYLFLLQALYLVMSSGTGGYLRLRSRRCLASRYRKPEPAAPVHGCCQYPVGCRL